MIADKKIASVYAEAGLELARMASKMEELEAEFSAVLEAFGSDIDVWKFMESPIMPVADKIKVLDRAVKPHISELLYNFIGVLIRRKRLDQLPEIVKAYIAALDRELKRRRVLLQSPVPVSREQIDAISAALQKYFNSGIIIDVEEKTDLIGGVVIRSGDLLFDMSLKNSLSQVKNQLLQRKVIGEEYYEN